MALLAGDPRAWVLASGEPAAQWVTLTRLLDLPRDSHEVSSAHAAVLADAGAAYLVDRLPDWESTDISGHNQAGFAPNLVSLGQKKRPSPFATAHLCAVLRRFEDLADDIAAVDVTLLTSSKGGTGLALPPR